MQGFQKIDATSDVLSDLTCARPLVPTDIGVEFDDGPISLAGTIAIWATKIAGEQSDDIEAQEWEDFLADDELLDLGALPQRV